ncbi:MAG: hypothetical protein PHI49_12040 [Halothiobacillaceae bacterium]|nr:hypothetical protein [Halothiobacillaceae bacterium]
MSSLDHFAVGVAIRDRLAEALPALRQVRIAASLAEIADWQPVSPAVWVIWDGDRVAESAGRGQAQLVRQRWVVALIVRSLKDAASGGGVIEAAGPLLSRLLALLMGWQPPMPGCRPLERTDAPQPGYGAGYGYFPLAFLAPLHLHGDPA